MSLSGSEPMSVLEAWIPMAARGSNFAEPRCAAYWEEGGGRFMPKTVFRLRAVAKGGAR
jgi:hypothetical protein